MPMPSASATVSRAPSAAGARAQEVEADEKRRCRRRQKDEVPDASVADRPPAEFGRIDDDAGRKSAPRFVLTSEIDHDKVQRERAHGQIKPAQSQRRQPEDDAEKRSDQRRRGQSHPERRIRLPEKDSDRERARREQAGVAERNLSGIAGQQHEGERADAGKKDLERRRNQRKREQRDAERDQAATLKPRLQEGKVLIVVGAEIAAGARRPKHGQAPRACRTAPTAARSERQ